MTYDNTHLLARAVVLARAKNKTPILAAIAKAGRWPARWARLIAAPALVAGAVAAAPAEPPPAHSAPPSTITVYDKTFDLRALVNPVRAKVLTQLKTDPAGARKAFAAAVRAGRDAYFTNCVHCHGDQLDGQGMFAATMTPRPTNFRESGRNGGIAKSSEAYLFWRIATGAAGLPKQAAPWNSVMPAGRAPLSENDVWNVIVFLYDRIGRAPKMRDAKAAEAMAALNAEIQAKRRKMMGMDIFQTRCVGCHGEKGRGDGPAAKLLYPAPRDFTLGLFKYKTSPPKIGITDDDLFRTIKNGLTGTGMPAWKSVLGDDQIRSLIPIIKGFDTVGTWAPEDAPDEDFDENTGLYLKTDFVSNIGLQSLAGQVPFGKESVAKGESLFKTNCSPCHGENGRGNPAVEKRLRDDWNHRVWPRDLTKPWTWRVSNVPGSREKTIRKIFTRFSVGIPGTRMPQQSSGIKAENRWHIANYVFTLRKNTQPLSPSPVIRAVRVKGALPNSIDDGAWAAAPSTTLPMLPNMMKGKRLFRPLNDAVSARVLYNAKEIAFLLELDDRTYSLPGDKGAMFIQDTKLELHSDAIAIQFPKKGAFAAAPKVEKPMLGHGDAAHGATIWYWNAGSATPKVEPYGMILDAAGSDKKLRPRNGDGGLTASGTWQEGRWRVLMKRRRDAGDNGDVSFAENVFIPISFANWDGSNGEIRSRHTLTPWYWLLLPSAGK